MKLYLKTKNVLDERETQEKVNKIKAEERKQKADDNRRRNRDW